MHSKSYKHAILADNPVAYYPLSEEHMSKKYLSTDPDCMAQAARRFHTLFGHWPEFIGINGKNAEAYRRSIKFPMLKDYIDILMLTVPDIDKAPAPAITMQEIPIKPYDGAGFYDFILWSKKTGAVTPEHVFNSPVHVNCKCSVKEAPKKPYIKVTIYNGDFTQQMYFAKCSIHTDSSDTTFQASSLKYSVIDPVD